MKNLKNYITNRNSAVYIEDLENEDYILNFLYDQYKKQNRHYFFIKNICIIKEIINSSDYYNHYGLFKEECNFKSYSDTLLFDILYFVDIKVLKSSILRIDVYVDEEVDEYKSVCLVDDNISYEILTAYLDKKSLNYNAYKSDVFIDKGIEIQIMYLKITKNENIEKLLNTSLPLYTQNINGNDYLIYEFYYNNYYLSASQFFYELHKCGLIEINYSDLFTIKNLQRKEKLNDFYNNLKITKTKEEVF